MGFFAADAGWATAVVVAVLTAVAAASVDRSQVLRCIFIGMPEHYITISDIIPVA